MTAAFAVAVVLLALGQVLDQNLTEKLAATATTISGMDASAIGKCATGVVIFTQLLKWAGLPDRRGPLVVLAFSAISVTWWGWSYGSLTRASSFDYASGALVVAATAAGFFGFTRAAPAAVTSAKNPPVGGAGSNITDKPA